MNEPTAPVIRTESTYLRTGARTLTLVVCCPYCDAEHRHGAGTSILTARDYLGPRAPDCAPSKHGAVGYIVTDPSGLLPGGNQ